MSQVSSKNMPLSAAGVDLGLVPDPSVGADESEEEKKKRLAGLANQQQQMAARSGNPGMSAASLAIFGGGLGA